MGRGRKKINDRERKSVRKYVNITPVKDDIISQYAAITNRSKSDFIRAAIDREIEYCRSQLGINPPNYDDVYYDYEVNFDDEDYENDDE